MQRSHETDSSLETTATEATGAACAVLVAAWFISAMSGILSVCQPATSDSWSLPLQTPSPLPPHTHTMTTATTTTYAAALDWPGDVTTKTAIAATAGEDAVWGVAALHLASPSRLA